jgi:hypothetical protein
MRRSIVIFLTWVLLGAATRAHGAPPPQLLQQAVDSWLGERNRWAFTQRAVEYEGGMPHERLERYDPSRPPEARWQLLAIDGHAPTPEERRKWAEKKLKHHRTHKVIDLQISDFFDFGNAKVVAETPKLVRFEVPLRKDKNWLFPTDKVGVRVTINKETQALEHLTAHVREPFKVLLGLARVMGGELDLDFLHFDADDSTPSASHPTGAARVSVTKFGERVDFTWTDFKRVTPFGSTSALPSAFEAGALTRNP